MFDRLAEIEQKYMDLADQVNDPDIIANQSQWRKLMKEYSDMTPIVEAYREYEKVKASIAEELDLQRLYGIYRAGNHCQDAG